MSFSKVRGDRVGYLHTCCLGDLYGAILSTSADRYLPRILLEADKIWTSEMIGRVPDTSTIPIPYAQLLTH